MKQIKKYAAPLFVLGILVFLVVGASRIFFPNWANQPLGKIILIVGAAAGSVSFASGVISFVHHWIEMGKEDKQSIKETNSSSITTGGGAHIEGDVNTEGGDFVGRDKFETVYDFGGSPEAVERFFGEGFEPADPPAEGTLANPGPLPPGSWLPHLRNEVFTGRGEDLLALAGTLIYGAGDEKAVGVVQSRAVATGMGGIGKTQLAVEFCYRYGRFFNGVHWLQADQELEAEVARCGEAMGVRPWPDTSEEQAAATLKAWERGVRLVVFDNLEEPGTLRDWLPRMGGARVLITARRQHWPLHLGVQARPLGIFKPEESRDLLCELAPRLRGYPQAEIDPIGERLGHLPLAVELAGRYLEVMEATGPQDYLEIIDAAGGAVAHSGLLDWVGGTPTAHEIGLAATFQTSWARLEGEGEVEVTARGIFLASGYCAGNTPIPNEVLRRAVLGEEGGEQAETFQLAMRRLYDLGLLSNAEGGATIHPLLGEFARFQDQQAEGSSLPGLAGALATLSYQANKTGLPAVFLPLRAHLRSAAEAAQAAGLEKAGTLWNELGSHLQAVAEYARARAAYERALGIWEEALGPDHPNVAMGTGNLGKVLFQLGELDAAKSAHLKAKSIFEKHLSPDHPNVAIALSDLGHVLRAQGDLAGARAAFAVRPP